MANLSLEFLHDVFNRYKEQVSLAVKTKVGEIEVSPTRLKVMLANSIDAPQDGLEKIRGTNNLTSISSLLRGYEVGQAVGLVVTDHRKDIDIAAIGTGFLIAPDLFITNYHVIRNEQEARNFSVIMNYQRDLDGNIDPTCAYRFIVDERFITDENLDFTIVGVEREDINKKKAITDFGYLRMIEETGKISKGEFTTIIEHPNGRPKQIVLYENSILFDTHPDFILYSADTDDGSSGSPVLNYEWVVVALHHAGVPKSLLEIESDNDGNVNENAFPKAANEGIRVSALMQKVKEKNPKTYMILNEAGKADLSATLPKNPFDEARISNKSIIHTTDTGLESNKPNIENTLISHEETNTKKMKPENNIIKINIPLEIHLGSASTFTSDNRNIISDVNKLESKKKNPPVRNDGDAVNNSLTGRKGYDKNFLSGISINLADLYKPFLEKNLIARTKTGGNELDYTHFSIIMHKDRRMCLLTAVNIDGNNKVSIPRKGDNWQLDGRLSFDFQIGNELYLNNDLDRGHMVRREDPNWGNEAALANLDTFHYPNSCPQHKDLNQKTWLSLENYVLKNTDLHNLEVSVFTGPILDNNYVKYREALVPVHFYKIVAMVKKDGKPSVTGYVLTQKELLSGLEARVTEFIFGAFNTYQVSLSKIESMTGLDLNELKQHDPLKEGLESVPREILGENDIVF